MHREQAEVAAPGLDRPGTLIRYGHFGRPVLVFPTERGSADEYEANGMVDVVADLLAGGRAQLYCIDSFDHLSWSERTLCLEERSRRHTLFESWVTEQVVPRIAADSPGAGDLVVTGCGLGAYHALNIALRRADLFPVAICHSGHYDPALWPAWGERGEATYANNPTAYLADLSGDRLSWLRGRVFLVLTVGSGDGETDPTDALASARQMARLLEEKDIPHDLDEWGPDAAHEWPTWRQQFARHLPRFC
jgi:esterase/lipase superfamily enzyme